MRHRLLRRILLAAACSLVVAALPAPALGAPARAKRPNPDGTVPPVWDLAKPSPLAHPDVAPDGAGTTGDGSNSLSFALFDDGDMVVGLGTAFGHAGCWDDARYRGSLYDNCVWSANKDPYAGVVLEKPIKYRSYDHAYGLWVPSKYQYGGAVVSYCAAQAGEPYNLLSSKSNTQEWYCSKLPWKAWQVRTGLDLDADGGYWVWPVDLVNDSDTRVFAYSE